MTTISSNIAHKKNDIIVKNPSDGSVLGNVPIHDKIHVENVVKKAREAQKEWARIPLRIRAQKLRIWRESMYKHSEELTDLIVKENGKTREEAILGEVGTTLLNFTFFASKGPKLLKPKRISSWGPSLTTQSTVHYHPRGVVGLIIPWNYPLAIAMTDAIPAILAGNAVILKPSEWTPLITLKIKEIFDTCDFPKDLLQVITGDGTTGEALIDSGVNKITFTGSVSVGRKVAEACGKRLIPLTLELGGKAPVIVLSNANIERSARAIVFGGLFNSGQTCVSVERVYAHEHIYDKLLDRVVTIVKSLRQGNPSTQEVDMGAMTFPKQINIAHILVQDAKESGAKIITGGILDEGEGQFYPPTIISEVTQDMRIMHEEIFAPVIPFMKVKSIKEAISFANDTKLGLNAYIFGSKGQETLDIAKKIEAGTVMINDTLSNYGFPELPFGGIKNSGIGRVHGEEGLLDMCEKRLITNHRLPLKKEIWWQPYSKRLGDFVLMGINKFVKVLDIF